MSKPFLVLPPRICPKCGVKNELDRDDPPVYFSFGLGVSSKMECWRTCNSCGCHEKVEMVTASEVVDVVGTGCPLFDSDAGICVVMTRHFCRGANDDACPLSSGPLVIAKKS